MSTNYYAVTKCEHCGTGTTMEHLGKASVGWKFLIRAEPAWSDAVLDKWLDRIAAADHIEDEYGKTIEKDAFLAYVMSRQGNASHIHLRPSLLSRPPWPEPKDEHGFEYLEQEFS